ncbi:LIM domain-containing protein A-like [Arachis ipaensis]|uniref:LIM domain-containing protein A-like n=1 Tax=Arachis ipaensis TaxID=130454 RepID=UPI0007AFCDD2|nr:LIM domain-containing protein A-like [Arachis ipaensis]
MEEESSEDEEVHPDVTIEKTASGIYNLVINEAVKREICKDWWESIIVKLLGRKISLLALERRLESMWEFNPQTATINNIAVWVRLPGLAIEYYNRTILEKIGSIVGRTLKVDTNTKSVSRGKYARICVEVDLDKPLVSQYQINGATYLVEYEGLHLVCFQCEKFGHDKAVCLDLKNLPNAGNNEQMNRMEDQATREKVEGKGNNEKTKENKGKEVTSEDPHGYGPWMLVQRTQRERKSAKNSECTSSGSAQKGKEKDDNNGRQKSRFAVLQEVVMEKENESEASKENNNTTSLSQRNNNKENEEGRNQREPNREASLQPSKSASGPKIISPKPAHDQTKPATQPTINGQPKINSPKSAHNLPQTLSPKESSQQSEMITSGLVVEEPEKPPDPTDLTHMDFGSVNSNVLVEAMEIFEKEVCEAKTHERTSPRNVEKMQCQ